MTENAIRWAAAAEQLAQTRQQRTPARPPMSDQHRAALEAMSHEECFHHAYRVDDDVPRPPEAHPTSIASRREASPPSWRSELDKAWGKAFAPLAGAGELPWSAAVAYGQQIGVLPTPAPPAAPSEAAAAPPETTEPPAPPSTPQPLDDLFSVMQQHLETFQAPSQPSDEALLRNAWRSLPDAERMAVQRLVESQDFAAGYFAGLQEDWAAVLTGDALVKRLEDARRLEPAITPQEMLQQLIEAAR